MTTESRRHFLKSSALSVAAVALANPKTRAASGTQRVHIGVIGCGNQGTNHIRSLSDLNDARVVHVADVDPERLAKAASASGGANAVADFRRRWKVFLRRRPAIPRYDAGHIRVPVRRKSRQSSHC